MSAGPGLEGLEAFQGGFLKPIVLGEGFGAFPMSPGFRMGRSGKLLHPLFLHDPNPGFTEDLQVFPGVQQCLKHEELFLLIVRSFEVIQHE